mmetsp:Transcript_1817/g.4815  ORF Transcript_1817/g.4815 Transcript_1817/m.4815 type:complete len:245 (-) Transcript_1817:834-1568(-)
MLCRSSLRLLSSESLRTTPIIARVAGSVNSCSSLSVAPPLITDVADATVRMDVGIFDDDGGDACSFCSFCSFWGLCCDSGRALEVPTRGCERVFFAAEDAVAVFGSAVVAAIAACVRSGAGLVVCGRPSEAIFASNGACARSEASVAIVGGWDRPEVPLVCEFACCDRSDDVFASGNECCARSDGSLANACCCCCCTRSEALFDNDGCESDGATACVGAAFVVALALRPEVWRCCFCCCSCCCC